MRGTGMEIYFKMSFLYLSVVFVFVVRGQAYEYGDGDVWIKLGTTNKESGLTQNNTSSGNSVVTTVGGKICRQTSGSNRYIYFGVNINALGAMPYGYDKSSYNVDVVVDYFDLGTDKFTIQFDATDEVYKAIGYYPESRYCSKTNSKTWKRFVFHFINAKFFKEQSGGSDFRIDSNNDGDEYIASVSVLKPRIYLRLLTNTTVDTKEVAASLMANNGLGLDCLKNKNINIRRSIIWSYVEPDKKGEWSFSGDGDYDNWYTQTGVNRGFYHATILAGNNPLYNGNKDILVPPATQENFDAWGEYVYQCVNRYNKYNAKIWEIWNEPLWPPNWRDISPDTAERYAHMLAVSYQKAKEADPTCFIVSGGIVPINTPGQCGMIDSWMSKFMNCGMAWSMNAFGFHSVDGEVHYPNSGVFGEKAPEEHIAFLKSLQKNYIDPYVTIPSYNTENAVMSVATDDPGNVIRGKMIVRHCILQRAQMRALGYDFYTCVSVSSGAQTWWGLFDKNINPRLPYFNYITTLSERMRNTLYEGEADHSEGFAYKFKIYNTDVSPVESNCVGNVIVAWSLKPCDIIISKIPVHKVRICNADGTGITQGSVTGGKVVLSVSDEPKYIWYDLNESAAPQLEKLK